MGQYVTLQRAGRTLKCCCPFHADSTPSCTVYTDTESFYCFGCQVGGDVVSFIMRISNLSYIEAVRLLAERAGIPMPEDVQRGDDFTRRKQRIFEMNKKAAKFFFDNLRGEKGLAARQYLLKRGLTKETITKYGIGFASTSWTTLRDYMRSEGYTDDELIDAGLIARSSKSGGTYDFFMNRVMFPFINLQGNFVGFSGRTLDPNDKRKYLNTKETPVFKKSSFLFSMNFAKNSAAKAKRLLLCEGNMDVVSLNQSGFENSVATCGTAITEEHSRIISQYCDEVIICYDMDEAGRKAADKAINILAQAGVRTKVIKMDGAKDPDEYILKYGKERFAYLLDSSEGAIEFNLRRCKTGLDMDTDIGKVEYLKLACEVLADIPTKIEREVYILKVAREHGISRSVLDESISDILRKRQAKARRKSWQDTVTSVSVTIDPRSGEPSQNNKLTKAQEGILAYIFSNPDKLKEIAAQLSPERFPTQFLRQLYESMIRRISACEDMSVSSFHEEFGAEQMGRISKICNMTKELPIDWQTACDYIKVLCDEGTGFNAADPQSIDLSELAKRKRKRMT